MLERVFKLSGVDRHEFLIDNCIRCQPPSDTLVGASYQFQAIDYCQSTYGNRSMLNPRVKVILAMGQTAFQNVTGVIGKKLGVTDVRGYVFPSRIPNRSMVPVVATIHPSHARRGHTHWAQAIMFDLLKAVHIADGTYIDYALHPSFQKPIYIEFPGVDEGKAFYHQVKDSPQLTLGVDLETDKTIAEEEDVRESLLKQKQEITQVQFSLAKRTGICFPWKEPFIKISKALLRLPNVKVGHNFWTFDQPLLKEAGATISGKTIDSMWLFHHIFPDLEMGLQKASSIVDFPFAWKHLSGDAQRFAFYGCADADAPLWLLERLPQVKIRPWGTVQQAGIIQAYEEMVSGLWPPLEEAQERGIGVHPEARLELKAWLEGERAKIAGQIQALVPDEVKRLHPAEGYKKVPPAVNKLVEKYWRLREKIEQRQGSLFDA